MAERGQQSLFHVATARLLLRRPTDDDAQFVLSLLSTPAATEHNPSDALVDIVQARARLTAWKMQWTDGLGYWIVERSADHSAIGICGVRAVDLNGLACWNLLYRLAPEAWGHGYAREAGRAAIRAAAQVDEHRPVIARIRPANTASSRVAAALGLERRPDLDLEGDDGLDEVWSTPRNHTTTTA